MPAPILTAPQIREIARVYDGRTETIDRLVRKFGCARHNVTSAARRLGVSVKELRPWKKREDAYLGRHYGRKPLSEICAHLDRSEIAVTIRKKKLGLSTRVLRDQIGYTVRDLELVTRLDHRMFNEFFDRGELKCYELYVDGDVPHSRVVSVDGFKAFLRKRPEAIDYRRLSLQARAALELDDLPEPPRYKAVTCRSTSYADRWVDQQVSGCVRVDDADRRYRRTRRRHSLAPCADKPFTFWVPTYEASPRCPRCGCITSRFSDKRLYRDDDPDEADLLRMLAGKLGLSYHDGALHDASGRPVEDEALLRYTFASGRNPRDAMRLFARLLQSGLSPIRPQNFDRAHLAPPLVDYTLQPRQAAAWEEFLRTSNLGVYWPPGEGKMFFLAYAYTCLRGRHALFVNTRTLAEQWIAFLREHVTGGVSLRVSYKPYRHEVTVLEADGTVRCVLDIWGYQTRHDFSREAYVLTGYDEAHFLPGLNAHRLALLHTLGRIGLTASPYREDGRGDLIGILLGGEPAGSWAEILSDRDRPVPAFTVHVVAGQADKARVTRQLFDRRRRTVVFVDAIEQGHDLQRTLGVPFVHGQSSDRLATIRDHRQVILSRVGDHGLDIQDLETVIEYGFFRGSRTQQLQRFGRLLHSRTAGTHHLLMTLEEFSRHFKRLTALEDKGIRFCIRNQAGEDAALRHHVPRGRAPAPRRAAHSPRVRAMRALGDGIPAVATL